MPLTNISNEDFHKLVQFIHRQYGIDLSQKRQLVTSRLSSLLSQKGYTEFGPFVSELLRKQDPADLELVLNRLTTNTLISFRIPSCPISSSATRGTRSWPSGARAAPAARSPITFPFTSRSFWGPRQTSGTPGCWPRTSPRRLWPPPSGAYTSFRTPCPPPGGRNISGLYPAGNSLWWRPLSGTM